ncbi:MAG TPA: sugar ABC transporter ATP-binding protein [Rectinemataceae bacterium]|nr:sugar ABC transporter ATP-binding protein [Rectinemataceae bacterium]
MLDIRSVSKSFPGVLALDSVSVGFRPGETHALLGENGAGKSTLMKIMCGIYQPDSGELTLDGTRLQLKDYHDAIRRKISIVHQELQVVPMASVAENIMLDKLGQFSRGSVLDWKRLESEALCYMSEVGLVMPPRTAIGPLSAAQKQLAQIARALSSGARVLLLDEPTSSLTLHEAATLFALIDKLKEGGVAIVFVTHKLEEVLEVSDVVTVLRDGKLIGTEETCCLDRSSIIEMMIGRTMTNSFRGFLPVSRDELALEAVGIHNEFFDGISLGLRKGEILGLYGLVGSGRTEFAKTVLGEFPRDSGVVKVMGKPARIRSVYDALHRYGIGYVSENRKEEGLILGDTVTTNIAITIWRRLSRLVPGVFSPRREEARSREMIERLEIRTPSSRQTVNRLSGGNQQKVSIAKWLVADCAILIIDEPTVGVDVGAKEYIHQLIWRMAAEEGKSIILISSDMPELISLARRILVFKEFRIVGELDDLNETARDPDEVGRRIGEYLA